MTAPVRAHPDPLFAILVGALVLLPAPRAALAQDPSPSDSIGALVPGLAPDSTAAAAPDSVAASPPDSAVVRPLPTLAPAAPPASFASAMREWGPEELLSTRALTLLELLEDVPGVTPLRGGDYGQPETATAFAMGAGRIRLFLDGIELPPLDGGVVDLSRVGLGGVERVRVERRTGELRIELFALVPDDPRPRTLLEIGTGDLNTNLFRGTFVHPTLFGGVLTGTLDRIDTLGPFGVEPGASSGANLRFARAFGDRFGLAFELRRRSARRDADLWNPVEARRSDVTLETRALLRPDLLASAYLRRSSLSLPGGVATGAFEDEVQTRAGLRVALDAGALRAEGDVHLGWGRGVPWDGERLSLVAERPGFGGTSVALERENWEGEAHWNAHARAWTASFRGVAAFAEGESGRRPVLAPYGEGVPSLLSSDDRTGVRAGLEWSRGELSVAGAVLRIRVDSLHPTGLPTDRGGLVFPGGTRTGVEASAEIPLDPFLEGLRFEGFAQFWDAEGAWPYLPRESYRAELAFHDVFRPSGNLEVWARVGAEGRDPMLVPVEGPGGGPSVAAVPFRQNWFAFLQMRVVSARIFVRWENLTLRRRNQDYPDRVLPATRAIYGVRWTLWN